MRAKTRGWDSLVKGVRKCATRKGRKQLRMPERKWFGARVDASNREDMSSEACDEEKQEATANAGAEVVWRES